MAASILIAEDEPTLARNLSRFLASRGWEVVVSDCVADAVGVLEARAFDLLLLDVNLPDGDGLDLYGRIRARWPRLTCVAMSGNGSPAQVRRARQLGIERFLYKPFALESLEAVLRDALDDGGRHGGPGRGTRPGGGRQDPLRRALWPAPVRVHLPGPWLIALWGGAR